MPPRAHNVISYSVSALLFWGVLLLRSSVAGLSFGAALGAALWTLHFVRRSLESAFLHRYSKPRIGPADYLTEYLYYWGFGAWIAWSLTAASYRAPSRVLQILGVLLFAAAELGNARAHWLLRKLRSPGGREKRVPRGFLFERVSCPHYFCEILSWLGFNWATGTWAGAAFMWLGAGILALWARTRHLAYRAEFDGARGREGYPAARRALIPFLW